MTSATTARRGLLLLGLAGLVAAGLPAQARPAAPAAAPVHCPNAATIKVPGAEQQDPTTCLADITTTGLQLAGRTDASDWAPLVSARAKPEAATPGMQVDGYFPDDSKTNTTYSKAHDAQFVLRFPDTWNGRLIVTGAPGVRKQYAVDRIISDWAVAHGYAYASTDKGNTGTDFWRDGKEPGDAILEWHARVRQLTIAAKATVAQVYGRGPDKTIMTGISNGGYLTRWALENDPELYDGGVDWEGTLFTPEHNLFTYLPTALKHYPRWEATRSTVDHDAMLAAGFAPGSEDLWKHHQVVYWDLTQRVYREEFDPTYDGATAAGTPFCQAGTGVPGCDADYVLAARPQAVRDAIARVSLTGKIGKPMLTLHGTLDALLPPAVDSDVYDRMIDRAGRSRWHRYYVIQGGNHVDQVADLFPTVSRPILPCYQVALAQLDQWITTGAAPAGDGFVPWPASGDVANECALPARR